MLFDKLNIEKIVYSMNDDISRMTKNNSGMYEVLIKSNNKQLLTLLSLLDYTLETYGKETALSLSTNISSILFDSSVTFTKYFIACESNRRLTGRIYELNNLYSTFRRIIQFRPELHEVFLRGMIRSWKDIKLSKIKRIHKAIVDRKYMLNKAGNNIFYGFDRYLSQEDCNRVQRVFLSSFLDGSFPTSNPLDR